eukprot:CAMPEP_0197693782 /NCGR_PEP_ID=MMETSP1338-20131121/112977_1 /TAXON_ID=43686 ORGANISM="Pelagodinium beii, Strain RCC1491" /NCGR_SAMPLE_ID=MMETSP1338 /ASSEMBLY_ACC=CAM_ASM_000754 /LENGTH=149 /DNA_ID=CAMNT_0043276567 /DNA_START=123 /DNA_END=569 /DNA_ORIENTATION=+
MFIHKDGKHLASNLRGILTCGLAAFNDMGAIGPYAVFLASGIMSAFNSWGRSMQTKAQLQELIPKIPEKLAGLEVSAAARNWWDSVRSGTARISEPIISAQSEALGASGGVCGLMGYGFGTSLCKLWIWLADRRSNRNLEATVELGAGM